MKETEQRGPSIPLSQDEPLAQYARSVINASGNHVFSYLGPEGESLLCSQRYCSGVVLILSVFYLVDSLYRSQTLYNTYPYDVTVTWRENEGFGFVIISSVTKSGSTIGKTEIKLDRIPSSALQANSLVKIHFVCTGPPATYSVAYCC